MIQTQKLRSNRCKILKPAAKDQSNSIERDCYQACGSEEKYWCEQGTDALSNHNT